MWESDIKGKKWREKIWERNWVRPSAILSWPEYAYASLSLFLFPSLSLSSNKHRARGSLNQGLLEPNQNSTGALSPTPCQRRGHSAWHCGDFLAFVCLWGETHKDQLRCGSTCNTQVSVYSCSAVKQVPQIKPHMKHVNTHEDTKAHCGPENTMKWWWDSDIQAGYTHLCGQVEG